MACPRCGSGSVRADRSLAGRLVCGRCGAPLGGAMGRRTRARRQPQRWRWWLLALLAAAAALATVPTLDPGFRQLPWPDGSRHRPDHRWQ
ncbi:MAG: transcriptional regulator [Vulcanococcus sp.]